MNMLDFLGQYVLSSLTIGIFALVLICIVFDLFDKSLAALIGAMSMIVVGILTPEEALKSIHFETILLLIAMMTLVNIAAKSGIFEWLSLKIASITRGSPLGLFVLFSISTAVLSAVLDNVTTIIILIPLTIEIIKGMGRDPKPYIFAEIIFSNIGGGLTLIGDPSNIIIGGATQFSFMDFLSNLWIPILSVTIFALLSFILVNWKSLKPISKNLLELFIGALMLRKTESKFLKKDIDKAFTTRVIVILLLTLLGFVLQKSIGLPNYIIAFSAALILALLSKKHVSIHEAFESVEWTTLFFFSGLFIMVGGVEKTGLLDQLSDWIVNATDNLFLLSVMILWISGFVSMLLDNIPFVTVMVPVILGIEAQVGGSEISVLWWALSMGACLGGNGTIIGASANVVGTGIAKSKGIRITFLEYMKFALPMTIGFMLISTIYLYFRTSF